MVSVRLEEKYKKIYKRQKKKRQRDLTLLS